MARQLRIEYPGAFYHVTSRGNQKQPIFLQDDDRRYFLSRLDETHEKKDAVIHAYCLMENHYHLILETPRGNLSKIMHSINTAYTIYFNGRHSRCGHLFQCSRGVSKQFLWTPKHTCRSCPDTST